MPMKCRTGCAASLFARERIGILRGVSLIWLDVSRFVLVCRGKCGTMQSRGFLIGVHVTSHTSSTIAVGYRA